jgi:hypothetical protein
MLQPVTLGGYAGRNEPLNYAQAGLAQQSTWPHVSHVVVQSA